MKRKSFSQQIVGGHLKEKFQSLERLSLETFKFQQFPNPLPLRDKENIFE